MPVLNMPVLTFLSQTELREFIDPEAYKIIDYFLKKVAFSQPELSSVQNQNNIQITKEFLEQWVAQACNLTTIGSGSYPIDVYKENEYGIDVKFISAGVNKEGLLKASQSNETSLGQNFRGAGKYLDQAFEKKEYQNILNAWINLLKDKLSKPLEDFNLKALFYFFFIRAGNKIHLSVAKVNVTLLDDLMIKNSSSSSVFVNNFIDEKYGNVKIYKAKKRMELRVHAKNLQEDNLLVSWDFKNLYPSFVLLREVVKNDKLDSHISSELKRFF